MFDQQDDISDDEAEEPSSSLYNQSVEDALASFREKWQQELNISTGKKNHNAVNQPTRANQEDEDDCEEKATMWYAKGAELERSGIFYEAIQCYKKAVQLVPDIEFKICQKPPIKRIEPEEEEQHVEEEVEHEMDDNSDEEDIKAGALLQHIQRKLARSTAICMADYSQRAAHIASLPTEILLYIFRWVVSCELDVRSLDVCAAVCRGFYVVARDPEIWRAACARVWGAHCGPTAAPYTTWREMYLNRARLQYNGCYISKTTYIRHGENSFQDQFYRPWHLVCYYRYLRFFPEGVVLMLTTADEPHVCVPLLKGRTTTKAVLRGHYRLKDDRVVLVVQDQQRQQFTTKTTTKGKVGKWQHESGEQTFHLEFQIVDQGGKCKHVQLAWKHYDIFIKHRNGTETKSSFDIVGSKFPPLWFSRVKSYTKETLNPLV